MSLLDKITFLKNVVPNIIEILKVVLRCLEVVVVSTENGK